MLRVKPMLIFLVHNYYYYEIVHEVPSENLNKRANLINTAIFSLHKKLPPLLPCDSQQQVFSSTQQYL